MQDPSSHSPDPGRFRRLPGIHTLLQAMSAEIDNWGREAVARSLRDAMETDPRKADAVPSTKGAL